MPTEPTAKNVHLAMPPVLVAEMEEAACAEGKTVDEIAQAAVQRFLDERRWQRLVSYGKGQAQGLGLKTSDVPGLIDQSRREQKPGR
jgi:hypothetical protein